MQNLFKKTMLAALAAALVLAALPMTGALAQEDNPPRRELSNDKLEKAWAQQLKAYEMTGKGFEDTDGQIAKIQALIDKAAGQGKDVSALQAALDAFAAALKSAKPIYDTIGPIVEAHNGFDANGKVTDSEQARATLKEMRTKLQELKAAMNGTGRALHDAIKAFREAQKNSESDKERDS